METLEPPQERCKSCDHLEAFHFEDGCTCKLLGVRAVILYRCVCQVVGKAFVKPTTFPKFNNYKG